MPPGGGCLSDFLNLFGLPGMASCRGLSVLIWISFEPCLFPPVALRHFIPRVWSRSVDIEMVSCCCRQD